MIQNKGNITVVNIRSKEPYNLYIGRKNDGYGLPESIFHNPFVLKNESERQLVYDKYKEYAENNPLIMKNLHRLKGLTLGCWCSPKLCHGNALIELYDKHVNE